MTALSWINGSSSSAIAQIDDAVLYTRNPGDLRGLEGLITVVPVK